MIYNLPIAFRYSYLRHSLSSGELAQHLDEYWWLIQCKIYYWGDGAKEAQKKADIWLDNSSSAFKF